MFIEIQWRNGLKAAVRDWPAPPRVGETILLREFEGQIRRVESVHWADHVPKKDEPDGVCIIVTLKQDQVAHSSAGIHHD